MAQTARPTSLVSNANWTASSGSNFWDLVDESVASDADYITCPSGGANTIELGFGSLSDPMSSSSHTVYVRAKYNSIASTVTVYIVDGTTVVSTDVITLNASYTDHSFTLSTAEADAIVDYSDLRIRMTGGGNPLDVSQVYMEVPNAATGSGGFTSSPSLIEATGKPYDSPNPKGNGKSSDILLFIGGTDSDYERMWRSQYKPRTVESAKQKKVCTACGMYCAGEFVQYFRDKPFCPDHAPRETNRGSNAVRI